MRTLLTIAGFDPSSGAGVTADLAVFAALGFFGTACVTALTVQSTLGVRTTEAVAARLVTETLACLDDDLPPAAIKIGMLATAENVAAVGEFLRMHQEHFGPVPVVLDPVLRSSSGKNLLSEDGLETLRRTLLPLVDWVTPNLSEVAALLGRETVSPDAAEAASRTLQNRCAGLGVVATGGDQERAEDLVLAPGGTATWLRAERIASRSTHGTGCAFSSAMTCGLASGLGGVEAARAAKAYVLEAIRLAQPIGQGIGPLNLLWPLKHLTHVESVPRQG